MSAADLFPDAEIVADEVVIGEGAVIAPGVRIDARSVHIGAGARIERGTVVRGLGDRMAEFRLGDESFLGFASQILAPVFSMGDYSQLHNSGLHTGYKPLTIGHNCWIGQSSILNCTERLTIGNNVRIGTQSQLWTHVASGELLEGCTLYGENPLTLEDNVWIVGGGVISPGLTLGRNSIIMTGSVLTKSTEPFHTYAGVPAKDVTEKLHFWKPVTIQSKVEAMQGFLREFREAQPEHAARVFLQDDLKGRTRGDVVITAGEADWAGAREAGISLLDLATKNYLKQRSAAEIALLRFLVGYRARFLPLDAQ